MFCEQQKFPFSLYEKYRVWWMRGLITLPLYLVTVHRHSILDEAPGEHLYIAVHREKKKKKTKSNYIKRNFEHYILPCLLAKIGFHLHSQHKNNEK